MLNYSFEKTVCNPAVFNEGRLPAHADFTACRSEEELSSGRSGLQVPLDGVWHFHYSPRPAEAPEGFWRADYDLADWDSIRVPAHIQLEGYDRPAYVNTQYPWDATEELRPGEVPSVFNPVADYVRFFTLPEDFRGQEVRISFQGVESGFALWLNGVYLSYSEDSFSPADFRLTDALCEGENRLAVRVFKWTPGSWFEDQDFFRFSGIFRSVFVYVLPEAAVTDLAYTALPDESLTRGELDFRAETRGAGTLELLLQKDGETLLTRELPFGDDSCVRCRMTLEAPLLWSAEDPQLYRLLIRVKDASGALTEVIAQDVGFRRVEIKDGILLLNGKRLVFHGVNRHDFSSVTGRVPQRDELERDLITMKRHNIDAIRTSHYPNQGALYELCDRYGLYVIDENNMETHGSWDAYLRGKAGEDYVIPKDRAEFAPMLLDRAESMLRRDRNHACVLLWSCGNESYGGSVIHGITEFFHRLDPTRPVHYEGITWDPSYPDTSDVESRMYAPAADIAEFLAEHPEKPMLSCEYSHAMGNSCGAMHKYTDLTETEPHYQGGFLWDWADQTLWKKDRYGKWYLAYGGDHGERPTDWNFSGNGIVYGGDHAPSPKMQEVKFNYRCIRVTFTESGFTVKNRYLFTDTSAFRAEAILLADGAEVCRKQLSISVPPQEQRGCPWPDGMAEHMASLRRAALDNGQAEPEFALTVSFSLKEDCAWAPEGHEVAFGQHVFPRTAGTAVEVRKETMLFTVVRGKHNVGVRGRNFSVQFSSLTPGLNSYVYNGVELMDQIPMPNFWRAPTDNDRGCLMPQRCAQWKLASLYATGKDSAWTDTYPEVEEGAGSVTVRCRYCLPTEPKGSCTVSYEVFGDGSVQTTLNYAAVEGLPDMPEFGMLFRLSADYSRVRWYGLGPEETYADRQSGAKLGVFETTAEDAMAHYPVPQECGNRCGVRWLTVTDESGHGLRFSGENLSVNVLPWTPHEVENALHEHELPPIHYTVVRVALQQMGVGGDDSWGAEVHPEYLLPAGKDLTFRFRFRGI